MLIALVALDKPGALQTRIRNREAHLSYVKETDVVQQAGPFLNDQDEMIGSMIILDVNDMSDAESWAEGDPYAKADLFQSVTLTHWKRVIG